MIENNRLRQLLEVGGLKYREEVTEETLIEAFKLGIEEFSQRVRNKGQQERKQY
jgi:hypothetical protein